MSEHAPATGDDVLALLASTLNGLRTAHKVCVGWDFLCGAGMCICFGIYDIFALTPLSDFTLVCTQYTIY